MKWVDIREAERLLAGRSKPSSTLASKDWELAAILSKGQVYPGCFPAILLGKQKKKRKSYMSVFVIVLQRNPLVNLPKEPTIITFIWPYRKGAPLSRFILPFLKEFIYLFI